MHWDSEIDVKANTSNRTMTSETCSNAPVKSTWSTISSVRQRSSRASRSGSGPEREALEDLCRTLDIVDHVDFTGAFEHVSDVMVRFDVFALTSISESR